MSLRRSFGFLLTRRFSPRATPRMAPARSLHSLKDFPVGDGLRRAAGVAAAALASAAAYFRKGTDDDDSAARMKDEDMKARFAYWMKKNDKTYRDEEEKAMRFQVFKSTVEWIESQPPSAQENMLPEISYFADFTEEECPWNRSCVDLNDPESEEYREHVKSLAKYQKGEPLIWRADVKHGDKQATQVSA